MRTRAPQLGWLDFVTLLILVSLSLSNGAPIGSKTYIIHTVKNTTHLNDIMAKHAWYMELMKGAKELLPNDHLDDGMDSLHHVYHHVFNGFSARLTLEQAAYMETLPCILALYPDRFHHALTTHTPEFLGLTESKLWPESKYGDNVIIGIIDSGIWPERLSFSDHRLGPIPARWKGKCETGTNFTAANCNNKIIGARYISKGFEGEHGAIIDTVTDYKSPRDYFSGHGTHCASTAAGRWAYRASSSSRVAKGTARGMAPKSRIAVYKVLWRTAEGRVTGADSDIMHAFDQAVADGVDVISISIGPMVTAEFGINDLFEDATAIAAYHAAKKGIFVSVAGGNNGEISGSIANVAPWMTTAAATTTDREIVANVVLGNGNILSGRSTYNGKALQDAQIPIIFAGDATINSNNTKNASFCEEGTLNASLVMGKILLCNFDKNIIHQISFAETAGAVALILANTDVLGEELFVIEGLPFPLVVLGNQAREEMMTYITQSTTLPMATIHGTTTIYDVTAPRVAGFSSRGPINIPSRPKTQWLKPDIAAPGVDILAAGMQEEKYRFMSGTSMACPHVSGIAALLRSVHPKWSPASIKSAMMTTATTLDNRNHTITTQETGATGGPWDFGAGFVQPEKAMNPGLVYDMGSEDYLLFLCGLGYDNHTIRKFDCDIEGFQCPFDPPARIEDTNLPSFVARFDDINATLSSVGMTFNRTLTNVAHAGSIYTASVDVQRLERFHVVVEPSTLTFPTEASVQKFTLTVAPRADANFNGLAPGDHIEEIAAVSWSDSDHVVQSPIVIMLYV